MVSEARTRMIEGATRLLAERGLQETSFSEVLALTGAPRGSIYHHFPDGKDQLVGEAVQLAGERAIAMLESKRGSSAAEVAEFFLEMWRTLLTRTDFRVGCSVVAVTVATDSAELTDATAAVFRGWRARLAELLEEGGVPADQAGRLAATVIAGSEGAVVLSRAERSIEAFDLVAAQLVEDVRRASGPV
ncbi:TetR/AcrR family transcriptional regulator [Herbiconiux sp. UC225_62]|uniref:TetR/AcrR family transcriptional regulator n=1 Tax=Herbiconiux sp. UC225_62 TaxID=3350168 RepID=UPI0036D3125B